MAAECANSSFFVLSTLIRPDVVGGKVSPSEEYEPLLFLLLRDQNKPVDQVAAAALLKYGQKCT